MSIRKSQGKKGKRSSNRPSTTTSKSKKIRLSESKRLSTTKLAKMLNTDKVIPDRTFTAKRLRDSAEAYDRDVRVYIRLKDMEQKKKMLRWLEKNNLNHNSRYSPNSPVVEIGVTYFKAWHYDI